MKPLLPTSQYTANDVQIVDETNLFTRFFKLTLKTLRFRCFEGKMSEQVKREVFEQGESVGVLVVDPKTEEFLLLEQFRVGALKDTASPWLYEIIAGRNDKAENLMDLAKREAKEEANIHITHCEKLCEYWVSPGATDEKFVLFLAYADLSQAGGVHGMLDEAEDIRVHKLPVSQIPELLRSGSIRNSMTLIALHAFLLKK